MALTDPIAVAWAHCNPRVPIPVSLNGGNVGPADVDSENTLRVEVAKQQKLAAQRKRRRSSAGSGPGVPFEIKRRRAA